MNQLHRLWRDFCRFTNLFPCPRCQSGDGGGANYFCPECETLLPRITGENFCLSCGDAIPSGSTRCPACIEVMERLGGAGFNLPWNTAVCVYHNHLEVRKLIYEFKFRRRPELASAFGHAAVQCLQARQIIPPDILIPIPLTRWKQRKRTYNQAYELAYFIGAELEIPVLNALHKEDDWESQAEMNFAERIKHLLGSFTLRVKPEKLAGRRLMLIDDIFTTGSTLLAASDALHTVPHVEISVLTIARSVSISAEDIL